MINVVDGLYFAVTAPCSKSWPGMRHSEDVRIVLDRAMDHAESCERCRRAVPDLPAPDDSLEPSPAELGDTMTVEPGEWTPLDDYGTQLYVYGDRSVDIAVQAAEQGDEVCQLRAEVDRLREQLTERRDIPAAERPDPNHACAAHDDAHLGRPCPGDDWDPTGTRPSDQAGGA